MQVRPFRWKNLPKYSRESAALLHAFSRYLATEQLGPALLPSVAKATQETLKTTVEIYFDHLRAQSLSQLAQALPETTTLVRIGLEPRPEKIIWEIDPVLASMAVDRLLGGRGDDTGIGRSFTDIEQGVLTFALLRLVRAFRTHLAQGTELAVRLEGLASSFDAIQPLFPEDETFHVLAYKVVVGGKVGFSRLCVPTTLTAAAFSAPAEPEEGPLFWKHLRANLARVGEQRVLARVRIASLDLAVEDRDALAVGDIVLFENHELGGSPEHLEGAAMVHLGRGKNGRLKTQIVWRNGHADLQISSIMLEEEPQHMANEGEMNAAQPVEVEEGGAPPKEPDDNIAESGGLLRDVPAPIAVELARLQMSTAQVIRLRAGQILRLGRAPQDPVDLVVNNRIFARGELIEVDGELGVRLIQLAK